MELLAEFGLSVWLIVKVGVLIMLLLYIAFAFVVDSQVRLMNDTLEVGFERQIRYIAKLHFALSILVFVLAVFIL